MTTVQWIAAAVIVVGLGTLGWKVVGAFQRSADADRLEVELADSNALLKAQVEATGKADRARLEASAALSALEAERDVTLKETTKYVIRTVKDSSECDLPIDSLRVFNAARGYPNPKLPPTSDGTVGPSTPP